MERGIVQWSLFPQIHQIHYFVSKSIKHRQTDRQTNGQTPGIEFDVLLP